jgi:hypothetical protein
MLRSIGVVVGSYLLSVVLVLATGPHHQHRVVHPGFHPVRRSVRAACPAAQIQSCAVVFVLGEVMGIAATVPNWSSGLPHWYSLSWLLAWPICCWRGFIVVQRSTGRRAVST